MATAPLKRNATPEQRDAARAFADRHLVRFDRIGLDPFSSTCDTHVRLEVDEDRRLGEIADRMGLRKSALIRIVLRGFLANEDACR